MKTVQYLDAAKVKLGITSDNALAKTLGLTQQAVSLYRTRGSTFDPTTATKIAEILEINPMRVIADAELERARSPGQREFWRAVLGKVAAIAGGAVGLAIATYPAECVAAVRSAVCILCEIARRWRPCKIFRRTLRRAAAGALPPFAPAAAF